MFEYYAIVAALIWSHSPGLLLADYAPGTVVNLTGDTDYISEDDVYGTEDEFLTDSTEAMHAKSKKHETRLPGDINSSGRYIDNLHVDHAAYDSGLSSESAPSHHPITDVHPVSAVTSETATAVGEPGGSSNRPTAAESKTCISEEDIEDYILALELRNEDEEMMDDHLPIEQRLMNHLLMEYERSVRPVKNASDTVVIKMGLTLTQIFDMDEKNQVLVTNVWLDQEWVDMHLTWDPEKFDGLEMLRLPCHKIWLPDIVLYNNAAEYTDGLMPANAMITSRGEVFWPVPTKLQSTCKVDVTYFPFDEQLCKLKFGSWTYDGFQVDMTNRTTEVDLSNYVANGEWDLVDIKVQRNVVYYACCVEPFPDVTFLVHIRRRMLYYLYNVIFPCIMMSALTLLVFCLPPDSGEKITMGITVLLAFSVFMLTVAEDLPETSEFIPLLSIYLTIVMAMTSVSVILTVFVLNLHHRGPNDRPVPPWLRRLFLRKKSNRGLCLKRQNGEEYYSAAAQEEQRQFMHNVPLRLTIENLAQELKDELENCNTDLANDIPRQSSHTPEAEPPDYSQLSALERQRRYHNMKHQVNRTNEEILGALKKIIDRYERDDTEEAMIFEWRMVAMGVDRILFWIFLVGTVSSTIIILIVAPLTKWL